MYKTGKGRRLCPNFSEKIYITFHCNRTSLCPLSQCVRRDRKMFCCGHPLPASACHCQLIAAPLLFYVIITTLFVHKNRLPVCSGQLTKYGARDAESM